MRSSSLSWLPYEECIQEFESDQPLSLNPDSNKLVFQVFGLNKRICNLGFAFKNRLTRHPEILSIFNFTTKGLPDGCSV
ncbi:hypothetical protein PNK_0082 [Candidatus Protochlamydia naegleriophila]|uniref:Uncharacterized protein n=1 Tax=Candidatus Protochlamydia naegleriophila TaxID=389348 RepID=A0A0U5J7K1_9BACT|nr:hypothetical protein PNK_0082 [Candidatus Protochlamydia naegleriophila]